MEAATLLLSSMKAEARRRHLSSLTGETVSRVLPAEVWRRGAAGHAWGMHRRALEPAVVQPCAESSPGHLRAQELPPQGLACNSPGGLELPRCGPVWDERLLL